MGDDQLDSVEEDGCVSGIWGVGESCSQPCVGSEMTISICE